MENLKFNELNVSKEVQKAIKELGFEEATPIQSKAIPKMLEGKDIIGLAQTGTGKTCAFGHPLIESIDEKENNIQALVLCPTRELSIQAANELQKYAKYKSKTKILAIYGGQAMDRQIASLKKKQHIIVGTPGRIMDHMRRKTIDFSHLRVLVLDEADEMLNMGFREDIDTILKDVPEEKQMVLFSATMSKAIKQITNKYLKKDRELVEIKHKELTAPKIKQYFVNVDESKKEDVLARILDVQEFKLAVLFCNTKRKVEEVKTYLQTIGYQVESLHGEMRQTQRDFVMKKFRSNKVDILVATDVAARGIDAKDVDIVINYDIPEDEEYYVHRIGRTGRAGREGFAISLVSNKDRRRFKEIERYIKLEVEKYKMPTSLEIFNRKLEKEFDILKEIIDKADLSEYEYILDKFVEENSVTYKDLICASLRKNVGKIMPEIKLETKEKVADKGCIRLFLNVGKLDGVKKKKDVQKLVSKQAKIDELLVRNISVCEKFSFFEVKVEDLEKVMKGFKKCKIGKRKVNVEVSTKCKK